MGVYLLLLVPTLITFPWGLRLGWMRILFVWIFTTAIMISLIERGSRDFPIYLDNFEQYSKIPFDELPWQDPVYLVLIKLWHTLGGSGFSFYITLASTAILLKLTAFRRLTDYGALAAFLYFCSYFFLHEFTQIRAALAIGIWMHAIAYLPGKLWRYALLTLLASTIHIQAVLGFALLPMLRLLRSPKGRRIFVSAALLVMMLAPTRIFDQLGFEVIRRIPDARAAIYVAFAEQDAWVRPNPFSIISLIAFATGALGLLRPIPFDAHLPRPEQDLIYGSVLIGCASLAIFSAITVGAFRISEHFFALLPVAMANLIYQSRARSILLVGALGAGILFSYVFLFYSPTLINPATGVPNE